MKAILVVMLTALAAAGFASVAASRFRLAADSYRLGNRLELVRSSILGLVMSLFAAGAGYGALMRGLGVAAGFNR